MFIVLLWSAMFTIRLIGPNDLMQNDQQMPVSYVLDTLRHGDWICQRDLRGEITSKPPLYTWLAAALSAPGDRVTKLSLYLPSALSVLGVALLVHRFGSAYFGASAGFFGALAWLLSMAASKHIALARTDALFAFFVTLGALLAHRAWSRGRGWTLFWLAASAATLAKGPAGPLIALFGLLASRWERWSGRSAPLRGSHALGVTLFTIIVGGWFWLSLMSSGDELIDKMIVSELIGHAFIPAADHSMLTGLFKPSLYVISRLAPWSLLLFGALWRVWSRPAVDEGERRFERFLTSWLVTGALMFSLAAQQRPDHVLPLLPAAALLIGREVAGLRIARTTRRIWLTTAAASTIGLGAVYYNYSVVRPRDAHIRRSVAMVDLAKRLLNEAPDAPPITHVDTPVALQAHLNTLRPRVSYQRAAELLMDEHAAAMVAVRQPDKLRSMLGDDVRVYEVMRSDEQGGPLVTIVSNRQRFEPGEPVATFIGPLRIRLLRTRLATSKAGVVIFQKLGDEASIEILNEGDEPQQLRLRVLGEGDAVIAEETLHLAPGESWSMKL